MRITCTVLVKLKNHISFFSMNSCKISIKLIDFAFKAQISPAFLHEIPPGNFLFLTEFSDFTLKQFIHETGNVAILIYKHCIFYSNKGKLLYICINIQTL